MLTTDFYKVLHDEVLKTADKNKNLPLLKNEKDERNKKSKAFLLWFLSFYGQQAIFQEHITDGNGDASCDIIFSNKDSKGDNVFYIVQAKWLNIPFDKDGNLTKKDNEYPNINKEEFNATLTDFTTVLNGSRQPTENKNFNIQYDELKTHLKANGRAKFIFFTAANNNPAIQDSITSFNREQAPNITLEIIDINRIKTDFINANYKDIIKSNLLEDFHLAEEEKITLDIVRFEESEVNYREILQFKGRASAYIVLLRPKTIHQLFKTYKLGLFYKNVRNPLIQSNYNETITQTLLHRPDAFWYFNNGITAITKIMPAIGKNAESFQILGLQIINGAQTIYSVYKAYEEGSAGQREIMDTDACIMLRLIRSNDEQFNAEITRYTNQQNQVLASDFMANDNIQERLQLESFKTEFWYQRRRGEFANTVPKNINIILNEGFANAYFIFHLQKPLEAVHNEDKFFLKKEYGGFYEQIFNDNTTFEDMLAAFLIQNSYYHIVSKTIETQKFDRYALGLASDMYNYSNPYIALSKIVLQNYLGTKHSGDKIVNLSKYIVKLQKENYQKLNKLISNTQRFIMSYAEKLALGNKEPFTLPNLFTYLLKNPTNYQNLANELANIKINIADFERE